MESTIWINLQINSYIYLIIYSSRLKFTNQILMRNDKLEKKLQGKKLIWLKKFDD